MQAHKILEIEIHMYAGTLNNSIEFNSFSISVNAFLSFQHFQLWVHQMKVEKFMNKITKTGL